MRGEKKMKILIVNLRCLTYQYPPDLGLAYLASIARANNWEARIYDAIYDKKAYKGLYEILSEWRPDVIGFKLFSSDIIHFQKLSAYIKKAYPNITIIAGGPHPTISYREMLNDIPELDFILIGESEIDFPKLLKGLEGDYDFSAIQSLSMREKGDIKHASINLETDLDHIPFPAWDLYERRTYDKIHFATQKYAPSLPIVATRGCPFNCNFCEGRKISGRKLRARSIDNVIKEIKWLKKEFGIKELMFCDENITLHKEYASNLARAMIRNDLHINWSIPFGVYMPSIEKEYFRLLEKSGLYMVSISFESGSQRVLNLMNKPIKASVFKEKTKILSNYTDIDIMGFFIIGYTGEKLLEIFKTVKTILTLPIHWLNLFIFTPIPGTETYKNMSRKEVKEIFMDYFDFPTHNSGIKNAFLFFIRDFTIILFYLRPFVFRKYIENFKIIKAKTRRPFRKALRHIIPLRDFRKRDIKKD